MKKALSVLLIAAALFGFYGGAVNLNDVLACKDYWEEEGEKSTADMNKLEDGLNQLKDNEQAYLDGLDQVAEGEEALAQGEADYAAGQAELAQGEADYAAAPGKLADAKKKIAKGENDLEEGYAALEAGKAELSAGEESINGLTKLIEGMNTILKGYNNDWRPGYERLKKGRSDIYKGSKGSKEELAALAIFLPETSQAGYVGAVNDVAGDDEKQSADDYKTFIESTNAMAENLPVIQNAVAEKLAGVTALYSGLSAFSSQSKENDISFAGGCANYAGQLSDLANSLGDKKDTFNSLTSKLANLYKTYATKDATLKAKTEAVDSAYAKVAEFDTDENKEFSDEEKMAAAAAGKTDDLAAYGEAVTAAQNAGKEAMAAAGEIVAKIDTEKATILAMIKGVKDQLAEVNEKVNGEDSAIKNQLLPGLKLFNSQATVDAVDQLVGGQDDIGSGIRTIASAVLGNNTLRDGVEKNLGSSAIKLLQVYKSNPNLLESKVSDFAAFEAQMDTKPGFNTILTKAKQLLVQTKADGLKTLAAGKKKVAAGQKELTAGEKKLAAGKKAYAKGLADYAAAPGKLAAGRAALAEGLQKLMDGRADLAAGKDKLAEYEDGEQQVRDGLATLMGTEANGGLTSIADRRSGDDDFDNGDKHLELDEGLDAVDVGRGYQADSGELITKEITGRAVGTAAGLGAAALAVLAGLLSLLKKNKGAGVSAILSAVAGGAGIAYGTSNGMEFSNIAGSTVGSLPWIAFGVLAAVAAVHAIAHFASKEA